MAAKENDETVWEYNPNKPASYIFTVLWLVTVVGHLVQMVRSRKWYLWVLIMGGAWELIGFALRCVSMYYQTEVKYYAPMLTLIVLAPVWIAAFYYMTIGRMILYFLPEQRALGLSAHRITLLFVLGDILSFLVQVAGSNLLTSDDPDPALFKTGANILVGGIALQTAIFVFFVAVSVRFEANYKRTFGRMGKERWRGFMRCINFSCGCIVLRNIFRIAEFAMPYPGPLVTHEVAFYLMEAIPMLPTLYLFHWWHPAHVLVGEESSFRAERKKRAAIKEEEKRIAAESQIEMQSGLRRRESTGV